MSQAAMKFAKDIGSLYGIVSLGGLANAFDQAADEKYRTALDAADNLITMTLEHSDSYCTACKEAAKNLREVLIKLLPVAHRATR